jgi:hypothetical protein
LDNSIPDDSPMRYKLKKAIKNKIDSAAAEASKSGPFNSSPRVSEYVHSPTYSYAVNKDQRHRMMSKHTQSK